MAISHGYTNVWDRRRMRHNQIFDYNLDKWIDKEVKCEQSNGSLSVAQTG